MINKQTLTKREIVLLITKKLNISKIQCIFLVNQVFEKMKNCLIKNEKIQISGFGKFVIRKKNIRKGRNPQTGKLIEISARKIVTFKSSPLLRRLIEKQNIKN